MSKVVIISLLFFSSLSFAQTHKGVSFQAIIKSPDGTFPSVAGLMVNAKILSPNNCVLWEEEHSGVNITSGYLNLVIGRGTPTGYQPSGQTFTNVYNNSVPQSGLTCLNSDGSVNSGTTTYTPTSQDGRKLRIDFALSTGHILADFNIRAMPFAVNAENLNGKSDSAFVQVNGLQGLTQSSAEQWFSSAVMQDLLTGTYNAPSASTAVNVTGTVAIANGGTGATSAAAARANLGLGSLATMNPTGTANNTTFLRGDGSWQTVAGGVSSVASKTGDVTLATSDITDFNTSTDNRITTVVGAWKGAANGLAALDASGKVPSSQLPAMNYVAKAGDTMTGALNLPSDGLAVGTNQLIVSGGNTGIGTTNPGDKLDVSGKIRATHICASDGTNCKDLTTSWGSGGTVTSVGTGTGLTGGPITGSGTISIAAGGIGSTELANNAVTTSKIGDGQVTNAKIVSMSADKISSGAGVYMTYAPNNTVCANGDILKWTNSRWECGTDTSGGAGTVTSVGLSMPAIFNVTNSPVTTSGSLTASLANQGQNTVLAGPLSGSGTPSFRNLQISDIKSSVAGDFLNAGGACSAGQHLDYSSVSDTISCSAYSLTSSQVTGALSYTPVNKAGDTMTGTLNLPSNGLAVGTNQLVVSGGNVGIGITTPVTKFQVSGDAIIGGGNSTFQGGNYIVGSSNTMTNSGGGNASGMYVVGGSNNFTTSLSNYSYNLTVIGSANTVNNNAGNANVFGRSHTVSAANTTTVGNSITNSIANSVMIGPTNTAKITILSSGNVGIGTTAPRATFDVQGTITGSAAVSNSTSTIDFSTSNKQYTAQNCASFNLHNLKDGGDYVFVVQGTTSATCSFTAYSDAGVTALTVHLPPDHGATTASKHTIYNMMVVGTHLYIAWTPGY